jgi:hypothetical protein
MKAKQLIESMCAAPTCQPESPEGAQVKFPTVAEVNEMIQQVFRKHQIVPQSGNGGFWQAVGEVRKRDRDDASQLQRLADLWDEAVKYESENRRPK